MKHIRLLLAMAFGFALLLHGITFADGVYIPPKLYPTTPSIPEQTALIHFKDGVETLYVESAASGVEGEKLAWILPVPSVPTEVSAASPGLLETMRFVIGPKLVGPGNVKGIGWSIALMILSFMIAYGLTRSKADHREAVFQRIFHYLLVLGIVGVLALLAVPGFLSARGGTHPNLTVHSRRNVGNYDVAVIEAVGVVEVAEWLEQEGFASLPPGAPAVVEEYAKESWCFVVASIRLDSKGEELVPHPLGVVFGTPRPVFPMRLTALSAGDSTKVNLFLVGNSAFSLPGFDTVFAAYFPAPYRSSVPPTEDDMPTSTADGLNVTIGRPEVVEYFERTGAWITRLDNVMKRNDMKRDLYPVPFTAPGPVRQSVYSPRGAAKLALIWTAILLTAGAFLLGLLYDRREEELKWPLVWVLCACLIVGAAIFGYLPKTSDFATPERGWRGRIDHFYFDYTEEQLDWTLESPEAQAAAVRDSLLQNQKNPFTGESLREIDSPGNFTVIAGPDGVSTLRVFDVIGSYRDFDIAAAFRKNKAKGSEQ